MKPAIPTLAILLAASTVVLGPPALGADARQAVVIYGPHFWPQNLTITWTEGPATLTFVNADKALHMPTSGIHDGFVTEAQCFFAGEILYRSTGEATIDPANPACSSTIYYHCHIHPEMQGNITLRWVP